MKKLFYILTILVLSLIITPTIFAKDGVSIESYELVDNSKTTTELSPPKINGLNISFDLSFVKLNDYAKYKIVVNNPTDNEYEISKDSDFNISNYITYKYEFEENDRIVSAKSKTTLFITITYSKMVPDEKLSNNKYVEDNNMAISLSTDMSSISKEENPNTAGGLLIICVLALTISLLSLILFGRTKKKRYITTMFISLLLIPSTILALEKLQINVSTKVTVEKKYKVSYETYTAIKESEKDACVPVAVLKDTSKLWSPQYYIINGEKYIMCSIRVNESYNSPGETIQVKSIPYKFIDTYTYNSETNTYENICTIDDANKGLICPPEALVEKDYNYMRYYGYDDPETQEFLFDELDFRDSYHSTQQEERYLAFYSPNSFTMPSHDVVIISMEEPYN